MFAVQITDLIRKCDDLINRNCFYKFFGQILKRCTKIRYLLRHHKAKMTACKHPCLLIRQITYNLYRKFRLDQRLDRIVIHSGHTI